ncbi:hypothetical protein [Actinomycetospora sp. TBRC 11914]|uniref:hypothetical protein n=1 Tax=Actinomycetospora sp. TBRC 11914 TaxID=2729387 RepID=UPI00145EE983|nr:hypothetical protein [Actinomycetospora sp. TBRC 11914]NMO93717.1 hypothetical protein [Actinomycetospora sp. TBRC 11914]
MTVTTDSVMTDPILRVVDGSGGLPLHAPRPPEEHAEYAMDAHALAETVFGRRLSTHERGELDRFWRTDWSAHRLVLDDHADRSLAATAIAFGTPVFHGSGPGYALTCHPDAEVVRAVRHALGRPSTWTPAVTTTRELLPSLVDPDALEPSFLAALDERLARGPVALTVPAAPGVPAHLTSRVDGVATLEVVVPGARCTSGALVAAALGRAGTRMLATTRPYATCPTTGRRGPALDRVAEIQRTFGRMRPGAVVLAHRSEWRARRRQVPLADAG